MQHPGISSSHLPLHPQRPRLAVYIDAENLSGQHAEQLMRLANQRGRPTLVHAYGDWTTDYLLSWKKWLHPLGIRPVQQFHYTNGKNASDAALIMDVMERLHRHRVDGICIASCDSDFVGLVGRVREHGPVVYGFGQYGASPAFVAACDEFVFLDGTGDGGGGGSRGSSSTPRAAGATLLMRKGMPGVQRQQRQQPPGH
jgi:hypothetical protein